MTPSSSVIILFISLTVAYGLTDFPDNVVTAKQRGSVTIPCKAKTSGPVTWKFTSDGEDEEVDDYDDDHFNLTVSEVEQDKLGEYSCWNGEEKLSSAYLLFEAVEEKNANGSLHCRAKSYNCNFSCKWNHSDHFTAVRLGLGPSCTEGEKSCSWNTWNSTQHPVPEFEITHSLDPCEEEKTKLEVTAEAINSDSYLKITRRFYLREIVQPDPPKKLTCQVSGENLKVNITPASSWSAPQSYFSLEHEIEYEYKDNGKTGRSTSADIPKGITKLRARSRDPLQQGLWSMWSPWINVRAGKKKQRQCKKTANCCCPPQSSKSSKKNRRQQTTV